MKIAVQSKRDISSNMTQLGVHVQPHIRVLAMKQARTEGKTTSAWVASLVIEAIKKAGTTLDVKG